MKVCVSQRICCLQCLWLPLSLYLRLPLSLILPFSSSCQARERLAAAASEVRDALSSLRLHFDGDGEEVQREWAAFTRRVDEQVLAALRASVKHSLNELCRLLNGDAKTEVLPLFR